MDSDRYVISVMERDLIALNEDLRKCNMLAAAQRHRINRVIEMLRDDIDGGEECRGRDSHLSYMIAILEGEIGV